MTAGMICGTGDPAVLWPPQAHHAWLDREGRPPMTMTTDDDDDDDDGGDGDDDDDDDERGG